jgi:hypothetical protein
MVSAECKLWLNMATRSLHSVVHELLEGKPAPNQWPGAGGVIVDKAGLQADVGRRMLG